MNLVIAFLVLSLMFDNIKAAPKDDRESKNPLNDSIYDLCINDNMLSRKPPYQQSTIICIF